jgi:hypothetical protein
MKFVSSHFSRLKIVEETMCVCLRGYETVNQLIWHCKRFETDALNALDVQF